MCILLYSVLEILSNLTKHPKLAVLAQQAIDRVLDSNLSAKYWQSGQLKHTDIIKDGFFDAGQVCQRSVLIVKTLALYVGSSWRETSNSEGTTSETVTIKPSSSIH